MKLKLDLHTHCKEALFYAEANLESALSILQAVKAKGLDGIAITEHHDADFGHRIKEIIEKELGREILIIPGQERDVLRSQLVELYLPEGLVFTFLAHPGWPWPIKIENYLDHQVQGVEIENGLHRLNLDSGKIEALAQKHDLLLLSNSDAHSLRDVGYHYNVIDIEELTRRARRTWSS